MLCSKKVKVSLLTAGLFFGTLCTGFGADAEEISFPPKTETVLPEESFQTESPDELLEHYIEKRFRENGAEVHAASSNNAGRYLTGVDHGAYKALKSQIEETAGGERTSTAFTVTLEDLQFQRVWRPEDLGLETFFGDAGLSAEGDQAIDNLWGNLVMDTSAVYSALLSDCAFELYWHDISRGVRTAYPGMEIDWDDAGEYVAFSGDFTFSYYTAAEYAKSDFEIDSATGTLVNHAVNKAAAIVEANRNADDVQKLRAYMDAICSLTTYNDYVLEHMDTTLYGNPWQLIWVFDEDPSTTVVCEGYAKAFQYLCELSEFSSGTRSILVSGNLSAGTGAGPHMWNLVWLADGENYLVDVTNCDDDSIGAPDQLFLALPSSGNLGDEYVFTCNGDNQVVYAYDGDTLMKYREADLVLGVKTDIDYSVENHLEASAETNKFYTADEASVYLQVNASCDEGELAYQWYRSADGELKAIDGADDSECLTDPILGCCEYICRVTDEYENTVDVSFTVDNLRALGINCNITLLSGQTACIPEYPEMNFGDIAGTGFDSPAVSCAVRNYMPEITARDPGNALVTIAYDMDGFVTSLVYRVYVEESEDILTFPEGLVRIEEGALSEIGASFAMLPEAAEVVVQGAFAGTLIEQLCVPGDNTVIENGAFDTDKLENMTILCNPGSRAEAFAKENGCPLVYYPQA